MGKKIVWITGASSGIGAEMARELARRGHYPILTARRTKELDEVSSSINAPHEVYSLDVTDQDQTKALSTKILEKHGRIDVLINNAGFGVFDDVQDADLDIIDEMMKVNYSGSVYCTKAVLQAMIEQKYGIIINICSQASKIATPKSAAYAATKHALAGFSRALRMELYGTGVIIKLVHPGPIDTPFFDRADPSGSYVKNISFMMSSQEEVVRKTLDLMTSNRLEINIPWWAGLLSKFYQLMPIWLEPLVRQMTNKK